MSIVFRGGSRTDAKSKMERFVLIINDWNPLAGLPHVLYFLNFGKIKKLSCIFVYLVDLSCIVLFFRHCLPKRKLFILFLEKCIIDRKKRLTIFSRFYSIITLQHCIIALLACFRCFDIKGLVYFLAFSFLVVSNF